MNAHITIKDIELHAVTYVEIVRSLEQLTATAKITLPKSVKLKDTMLKDLLQNGDKVSIKLGYNNTLNEEFNGYIVKVMPTVPMQIFCEDAMWILKQNKIVQSFRNPTLENIVTAICPNIEANVAKFQFGLFRINGTSSAKVFAALQEKYGIDSLFFNNMLYVGTTPDSVKTVTIDLQKNTVEHENDLQFRLQSEKKVSIKAISIHPDNTTTEVVVGDAEGEEKKVVLYNGNKTTLEKQANILYNKYMYSGYEGSITTFGEPFVTIADNVSLIDNEYPERAGSYKVKAVTTKFDNSGYRRQLTLAEKAD
ncbi:MAG: hypothetical protein IT272_11315 [Chitinophagales bacterium]|nr:hypothetical protein [Sphingobacteriales bacterium]MCC7057996.1 hypothetical protein [Chitinophagales bacterium]HMS52606.1 hypothetical protein [Chitinophagales bacterium]